MWLMHVLIFLNQNFCKLKSYPTIKPQFKLPLLHVIFLESSDLYIPILCHKFLQCLYTLFYRLQSSNKTAPSYKWSCYPMGQRINNLHLFPVVKWRKGILGIALKLATVNSLAKLYFYQCLGWKANLWIFKISMIENMYIHILYLNVILITSSQEIEISMFF